MWPGPGMITGRVRCTTLLCCAAGALVTSSFNGQRGGQVPGQVGISGSFQDVRDPRSPFVVDGEQFPDTGGGPVRRYLPEGHCAGVRAEEPLVEDVQFPPADNRPQCLGAAVHDEERGTGPLLGAGRLREKPLRGPDRSCDLNLVREFAVGGDAGNLHRPSRSFHDAERLGPARLVRNHRQLTRRAHLTAPSWSWRTAASTPPRKGQGQCGPCPQVSNGHRNLCPRWWPANFPAGQVSGVTPSCGRECLPLAGRALSYCLSINYLIHIN